MSTPANPTSQPSAASNSANNFSLATNGIHITGVLLSLSEDKLIAGTSKTGQPYSFHVVEGCVFAGIPVSIKFQSDNPIRLEHEVGTLCSFKAKGARFVNNSVVYDIA